MRTQLDPSLPTALFEGSDVIVELARAPIGTRVFLESLSPVGPRERVPAWAVASRAGEGKRRYRAQLPWGLDTAVVPIAIVGGRELRGEPVQRVETPPAAASMGQARFPVALELLAHAEAKLPTVTVFGATPEGVRMAFYIKEGRWSGPRINARYKSEGGDWLLVRKDGVAIPDLRATLETEDGALLFYRLTGTVDLGPDGYARTLDRDLPQSASLSVVSTVSTSSEHWSWLNRLTLVGVGVVDLRKGHVQYDLYSANLLDAERR